MATDPRRNTYRRKVLKVSPSLFVRMLLAGDRRYRVIDNGLSSDCRVVDVMLDPQLRASEPDIWFLIESESFEPVPQGEPYPELIVTIQTLQPDQGEGGHFAGG